MYCRKHVAIGYHPDNLERDWYQMQLQEEHLVRMADVKSTVKTDPPESLGLPFLRTRPKKAMERAAAKMLQEQDNNILMQSMAYIFTHKNLDNDEPKGMKVLANLARTRMLQRRERTRVITTENDALASRIDAVKSPYSIAQIKKDRAITDSFPKPKRSGTMWAVAPSMQRERTRKFSVAKEGRTSRAQSRKGSRVGSRASSRLSTSRSDFSMPKPSPIRKSSLTRSASLFADDARSISADTVDEMYNPLPKGKLPAGTVLVAPPPLSTTSKARATMLDDSVVKPRLMFVSKHYLPTPMPKPGKRFVGKDTVLGKESRLLSDGNHWDLTVREIAVTDSSPSTGDWIQHVSVAAKRRDDKLFLEATAEIPHLKALAESYEEHVVAGALSRMRRVKRGDFEGCYTRISDVKIESAPIIGIGSPSITAECDDATTKGVYMRKIFTKFCLDHVELHVGRESTDIKFERIKVMARHLT